MQLGVVVGQAVSTVKHASMTGWRLLVVQLLTADGKEDGSVGRANQANKQGLDGAIQQD